ncbi:PhoPQ-activated pathogenicity-related protein PqaA type [Emticicia oligotrophica DSM 17448]|uniref:PhoPQ-activated pathogenicity-related protein PqaA type n=1 Tax=Emticicia oligotrophica (strain DSM 17448 / CIP 109782 / MTCC 6937 / GPTSA100-15) TaxID=929562 RepID=A0ABM5N744_EMTOG|nr:PhoPQ-activated protein PqaA family protein [Emticicia oligotrophica]AFK05158.1 PhoPQ-activated pathogenicity-related protein PqaA type [Emticicia oligotrophica DSM 17448]
MKIIRLSVIVLLAFYGLNSYAQKTKLTPQNALENYIKNGDKSFAWELKDSTIFGNVVAYQLLLTSQKWREYTWRHQLTIFVPKNRQFNDALLFITGGSNKDEQPNWTKSDGLWPSLAGVAEKNKATVALIRQVPNQPLYGNLTEDALISYTLHQFKQDKDYSWPLLFPMVKSAVRAMDAVQEFTMQRQKYAVNSFVISGASKRGWTTWLSSAIDDKRVKAIAPMVIDMLNMPATLNYQYTTYGEYSIEIEDYVKLGIPQGTDTEDGKMITAMIDPFSYRNKMSVPKMIFVGTNDEYWTIDAIKHYINEIPGQNMIHYVPNVGHNLGGGKQAFETLSAFFGLTVLNLPYPVNTWKVDYNKVNTELTIDAKTENLVEATLWQTTSSDRDFRNNLWLNKNIKLKDLPQIKVSLPYPKKGYQSFYIEMKYKDPNGGTYSVCTRTYVTDTEKVL